MQISATRLLVRSALGAAALSLPLVGLAEVGSASPTTTDKAFFTPPGGIAALFDGNTYATGNRRLGNNSGTTTTTGYTLSGVVSEQYTSTISCPSYLPGGIVYYGGPVTSGSFAGEFVFGEIIAGGAGKGEVAGGIQTSLTCYNGTNGGEVGTLEPILAPKIVVKG
jgi:hypothetical protein